MSTIIKDLTVAIVTYQRAKQLEKCLDSLHHQSHYPQKILVIDNYFHKNVKDICRKYINLRITYQFTKKASIPIARNQAIKKCRTKYLAFVDDDCILHNNWTVSSYEFIKRQSNLTYVVGKTLLLNKRNLVARCQYNNYQKWFNNSYPLDTKNVIFNHQKVKKFRFDPKFKIFEDVDFNQQLKEQQLFGAYNPQMIVSHPESSNILNSLKKSYIRGQFKAKITSKWGNIDDFSPSIPWTKNPIDFLLKFTFNLGYLNISPKPIIIVNNQDLGANGERQKAFYNFLSKHHFFVKTINSQYEFEKVISSKKNILKYGYPLLKYKALKFLHDRLKIDNTSNILIQTLNLRGIIINHLLTKSNTSFAIIQYPEDMMVIMNHNRHYKTLYDSPTIYYKELDLSNNFSQATIESVKTIESMVYKHSDYTSFHWYSYFNLAKKYRLKITNPIILNWGCLPQLKLSSFKNLSKIIYLGKLNSYWVNPNLLSSISKKINLDIFSYEIPDKNLYKEPLKYRGFLKEESLLSNYQFGLISISRDDLRSNGFSAKYLLYLNYGLPILCPEWRKDSLLKSASIYYNEKNINHQIKKYSDKKLWLKKHQAALKLAKKLSWENSLIPLLKTINLEKNESFKQN